MNRILRKVLMNGIVVIPLLMWFTEATFLQSLITALVLTLIAYVIGDQLILRWSNNVVATFLDAILTFVYLWAVADRMNWTLTIGELSIITIAVAVVEFIYHRQLGEADADNTEDVREL